ncbi:MAG: hypothetical protein IJS96_00830 [Schwartzia sp.]|nr:hypothetical protein [Schwartzia sp. (in: firmicutes)]
MEQLEPIECIDMVTFGDKPDEFNRALNRKVQAMQESGLDVEIQYQTAGVSQPKFIQADIIYSAILIGRKRK